MYAQAHMIDVLQMKLYAQQNARQNAFEVFVAFDFMKFLFWQLASGAILKPLGLQMVANNTYTIKTGQYVIKAMASFKNLLKWFNKYFNYSDNPFFSRVLRHHSIFVYAFLTTIIVCPHFKMSQLNVLQARKTFKVTQ